MTNYWKRGGRMKNGRMVKALKDFIRNPYVWPGGYARVMLSKDCEPICHKCVKDNAKIVIGHTRDHSDAGWEYIGDFANWENEYLYCAHCGAHIPSEYAEDD